MPKKALITLLISIATHVAVVVALWHQELKPPTIHMGSVQAPVSLRFSTVSQPKPQAQKPESAPPSEPKPEPKVVKKPVKKAKPVLPKKEPKSQPVKSKPKTLAEKPKPVEKKSAVDEPAAEKTVKHKSEAPGLSNEPVLVSEPKIRHWVEPRYPKLAKRRNQQGLVVLDVIVDEQGYPLNVTVLKSSGYPVLDKAAMDAVKRWSFKPEQRNQGFVKSRVHIPVVFELS